MAEPQIYGYFWRPLPPRCYKLKKSICSRSPNLPLESQAPLVVGFANNRPHLLLLQEKKLRNFRYRYLPRNSTVSGPGLVLIAACFLQPYSAQFTSQPQDTQSRVILHFAPYFFAYFSTQLKTLRHPCPTRNMAAFGRRYRSSPPVQPQSGRETTRFWFNSPLPPSPAGKMCCPGWIFQPANLRHRITRTRHGSTNPLDWVG